MIIVMLWKPHGGKGFGHASLAVTRPKQNGPGNECVSVITWFPSGAVDGSSFLSGATTGHQVPNDVFDEMSRFMAQGHERRVYMPGVPEHQRPFTRFKPPSNICRITSLSDPEAMTGLSDANMLEWWPRYQERKDYDVLTRSCATAVAGGLLAGGGGIFAKPPWLASNFIWTPEAVYEWAVEIQKGVEPLNDKLVKQRDFLAQNAQTITHENTLWALKTWKEKSSVWMATRYQVLKDIDTELEQYHTLVKDSALQPPLVRWELEIAKLGQLTGKICRQLVERPKSARRQAVLTLGAQVINRIVMARDEIRQIQRKREELKAPLLQRMAELEQNRDQVMKKRMGMLGKTIKVSTQKDLDPSQRSQQVSEIINQNQLLAEALDELNREYKLLAEALENIP